MMTRLPRTPTVLPGVGRLLQPRSPTKHLQQARQMGPPTPPKLLLEAVAESTNSDKKTETAGYPQMESNSARYQQQGPVGYVQNRSDALRNHDGLPFKSEDW